jgi:hypothetical protein
VIGAQKKHPSFMCDKGTDRTGTKKSAHQGYFFWGALMKPLHSETAIKQ